MVFVGFVTVACFLGNSLAFEDAEVLVQQRQSASPRDDLSLPWSPRLDPSVKGIRVTRIANRGMSGSEVALTSSTRCASDAHGPTSCDFPLYTPFRAYFKISAPMGISKSDYVMVSSNSKLEYNRSSLWGWFMPRTRRMVGTCQFCSSSCTYNFWSRNYSLNVTTPTLLDTSEVCNGDAQKELLVKKHMWFVPRSTRDLALGGDLSFGIGLYDASGSVKADATYRLKFINTAVALARSEQGESQSVDEDMKPSSAEVESQSMEEDMKPSSAEGESESMEVDMKPSIGMLDVMQEIFSGMTEGNRAGGADTSDARSSNIQLSPSRVMTFNFSINSLAAGNSFSYMFDSGCSNPNEDYSALRCRLPIDNATIKVTSAANLAFDAMPGAKLSFAYQTRSNKKLMRQVPMLFQKFSIDAPLCGDKSLTKAKVSYFEGMPRLPELYKAPECGSYSFSFSTGGPKPFDFLNYLDMEPTDDMLPWSKTMWLKLTDHKDATIVDMEFSVGLEKA